MKNILIFFTLMFGCTQNAKQEQNTGTDNFINNSSVRISYPSNGAVVDASFTLEYEVGESIQSVELEANGNVVTSQTNLSGQLEVSLETGNTTLNLRGYGPNGNVRNNHKITVTVAGDDGWVAIISPGDGDTTSNPVYFLVNGHESIDEIELLADGYSLGFTQPSEVFSYAFTGTGFPREIEAKGYTDNEVVATDTITITVESETQPVVSDFNTIVLDIMETYPTDGSYGYYWPQNSSWLGTTQDIWYQGELIAEGDPDNSSYCVGLTWEVFMRAWEIVDQQTNGDNTINGMTVEDLYEFRVDWFVRDLYGAGPADAVENYGIGELVTNWNDIQPGDVLQFWRNNGSGHNTIFVDWKYSNGQITGVQYWSTQNSTDGIGYNTEYFGSGNSNIDPSYLFAARVYMPDNWLPWN